MDIRRRDVRELVEAIARKRSAPIMANRTLGVLSRMFNFALDREWIEASPAARIPEPGEERSRERVLSDGELRELWVRLESLAKQVEPADEDEEDAQDEGEKKPRITPATAQAFQVQLLTAQRPGEVRSMRCRMLTWRAAGGRFQRPWQRTVGLIECRSAKGSWRS